MIDRIEFSAVGLVGRDVWRIVDDEEYKVLLAGVGQAVFLVCPGP